MVYVIADLHGSRSRYEETTRTMPYFSEDDYVIVAGDAGLEYGTFAMRALKREMSCEACTFIIMRGNHDARYWDKARSNPQEWTIDEESGFAYENRFPNIKYIRDSGGVYDIGGHKILFVPGGCSPDKSYRVANGLPFEPREELTVEEADSLLDVAEKNDFDYVVSHVAPYSVLTRLGHLLMGLIDQSGVSLFTEKLCDEIYNECTWKEWLFGHYHADMCFDDVNMTLLYNKYEVIGDELPI